MRFFVCLLDTEGRGISDVVQRAYESLPRSRELKFQWESVGHVAVLTGWDDPHGDPLVASGAGHVAVGMVRLDNRAELEQWSGCSGRPWSDLELVLYTVAQHGTKYISQFLGDFAFVIWNATTRTAVVARDAFGVKKLYYAKRNGLLAIASRAEALALEDRYDVQYLAEVVAACVQSPGLSVYAGVKSLPAGTAGGFERGRLTMRRYWSPSNFEVETAWVKSEREAAETCRDLLAEAVRLRLNGNGDTWAQLSGGLDSSSVVSVAQWLVTKGTVKHGLSGTVTYVDSHGTGGDEREYSDAVVSRWRLRNEMIVDSPVWHDDRYTPPRIDQPNTALVFYPRESRLCAMVRAANGRVLLTGVGGDNLFTGNMFFFADLLVHGRVGPTFREMVRRAAIGRVSFWELAYRNALLPLLPRALQYRLVQDAGQMPPWVLRETVRRYDLDSRASMPSRYAGRIGGKYHHAVVTEVAAGIDGFTADVLEDQLDVRHPYLYRPLVEFALRLPPELCARPNERKWVLREAMRGILPDGVRTRVGKGTPYGRLAWSMGAQRALLEPLVRDPILADLGVVDAAKWRAFFEMVQFKPDSRQQLHGTILHTLAIEAWLQMRSGRWPRGYSSSLYRHDKVHTPSA